MTTSPVSCRCAMAGIRPAESYGNASSAASSAIEAPGTDCSSDVNKAFAMALQDGLERLEFGMAEVGAFAGIRLRVRFPERIRLRPRNECVARGPHRMR